MAKTSHKVIGGLSSAVFIALILAAQLLKTSPVEKHRPIQRVTQAPISVPGNQNASCHSNGVLPDPNCTPGVTDPRVTQDTIQQTICVKGYTKTVGPPASYTDQLKIQQMAAYGYSDTNPRDYEEDHLISLEIGGAPSDPKNLWPEPGASPNPKDKIENLCHEKICSGQISLTDAQHQIATNWQTACQ